MVNADSKFNTSIGDYSLYTYQIEKSLTISFFNDSQCRYMKLQLTVCHDD